jgi:FdhD protein
MDEAPFWIAVNGVRRVMLSCARGDAHALAVGHLVGEGWIGGAGDILGHAVEEGPGGSSGVSVIIAAELEQRAESLRAHQLLHGCGVRHHLDCGDPAPRVVPAAAGAGGDNGIDADLPSALRELFARADAVARGGVHAAAMCDAVGIAFAGVDVARHCAVDRVIGAAALGGAPRSAHGLVLTSRVSAAMVLKAARAGVPWIGSRSVATPLARLLAASTGVHIIEKAARPANGTVPPRGHASDTGAAS